MPSKVLVKIGYFALTFASHRGEVTASRAESAAARAESASLKEELTAVRSKKSTGDFINPFDAPDDDDRYFVEHHKDEKPAADGIKRWNPHQFPPRPPGCSDKPHLLPGLGPSSR